MDFGHLARAKLIKLDEPLIMFDNEDDHTAGKVITAKRLRRQGNMPHLITFHLLSSKR